MCERQAGVTGKVVQDSCHVSQQAAVSWDKGGQGHCGDRGGQHQESEAFPLKALGSHGKLLREEDD